MVDVITSIEINSPIESVSSYATNPDHTPLWHDNIQTVEWLTDKPLAMGSLLAFKAVFMGKEKSYTNKVVAFVPNYQLKMSTEQGPFPMETTYTFEAIEQSTTLMTIRNKGNPSGFFKVVMPLIKIMMKRSNKKDLKKIRSIIEKNSER